MSRLRIPSVFRNVQKAPRGFRYKSKYYNAKREEQEKRYAAIERSVAMEKGEIPSEDVKPRESIVFSRERTRLKSQKKSVLWSNIRLIILLILLVCGAMYAWGEFQEKLF